MSEISSEEQKAISNTMNKTYDLKNSDTHPIRYHDLLSKVFKNMETMSMSELIGAAKVIGPLSEYMLTFHFENRGVFNQKTLVKTIEEISENIHEDIYHLENKKS